MGKPSREPSTGNSKNAPRKKLSNPSAKSSCPDSFLYRMVESVVVRPFTALMFALAILLLGSVSFLYLKIEYMPTLPIPVVHVVTEYPGFPATEVERLVTIPLENGLSAVKGVRGMEAVTKEGISTISLRFDWKIDLRTITVDIREKIDSTYPYLPYGIRKPLVYTEDLNADPVLVLGVIPRSGHTRKDITPLVRKELSTRLLRIGGISSLRMVGTSEPEVLVEGKEGPIQAGTISLEELAETIKANVFQASLGILTEGEREYLVEADTGVDSVETLSTISIGSGKGSGSTLGSGSRDSFRFSSGLDPHKASGIRNHSATGLATQKLQDVAEISLREKERTSFFHWNGEEAIGIFLHKTPDASSLRTAKEVAESLPYLNTLFQREFRIGVVQNPTRRILSSLQSLIGSIGMGVLAVFLVLTLTFRNLTSPLIISFSIPLSTLGVFFYMYLTQISLNTVSLSGIALGIGMIVDNSIVVLETLHRKAARELREICRSVTEVFPSLFSSTVTTVLVFLPLALIPGVLGALFKDLALTISVLLIFSLGTSLFFTPPLYLLFSRTRCLKDPKGDTFPSAPLVRKGEGLQRTGIRRTQEFYRSYLLYSFRHPAIPLGSSILLIGVGCLAFFFLPKRLLPEETPETLTLTLSYPPGTSLEVSSREVLSLEKKILSLTGVRKVFAEAGYETRSLKDKGAPDRNPWTVRIAVQFEENESARIRKDLESQLSEIGGIEYRVEVPADGTSRLLGATDTIQFRAQGSQREDLLLVMGNLFHQEGVSSRIVSSVSDTQKSLPQKSFDIKEDLATYHGITPRYILDTLSLSLRGTIVSSLPLQGEDVDLRLRLGREEPAREESGSVLSVPLPLSGGVINTGMVGTLRAGFTYPELHRADRKPSVTWTFYPKEGQKKELETVLDSLTYRIYPSSDGFTTVLLSRSAITEQGIHMLQVFGTALLLMYLVLGAQFESFGLPILLLVSFPLSIASSFLCLYLFGFSLNLNSFLGILVLLGTIINGTILLTSAYRGKDGKGVIEETITHLRPLLATVNTSLVALLPLLLGGRGSPQAHTAIALGGGLGLGTFGILAVYPGLYRIFYRRGHPA